MMMLLHPDVAANAQKEIDGIIGSDPERLPTIKDRDSLPYLECVLKELYRYVHSHCINSSYTKSIILAESIRLYL